MKSRVWPTQNHSFYHPWFPPKCVESNSEGPSFGTLWPPKSQKGPPKKVDNKMLKIKCPKTLLLYKDCVGSVGFGCPFSRFFGPGSHLATKAPQSKKKVTKRSLKLYPKLNCTRNLKKSVTEIQKTSEVLLNMRFNYIKCLEPFLEKPGPAKCA